MTPRTPRKIGFTLVELLVVLSVISLLISLVLPVLGAARGQAKMLKELAAARQLTTAYYGYALDRRGELLPGYADAPATDGRGHRVSWPANARYPWRLAAYLDHHMRGAVLVNEQEALWDAERGSDNPTDWYYRISVEPSFGMNMNFLGGDRVHPVAPTYITRLGEARHPSRLINFGSAHNNLFGSDARGYYQITSPAWSPDRPGGWSEGYDRKDPANQHGFVDARYQGRAVFSFLDGHAGLLDITEMRDMTHWANQANAPDWTPRF